MLSVCDKNRALETTAKLDPVVIPLSEESTVSGVVGTPEWWPTGTRVAVVLAHDVGSDMNGELLTSLHRGLADRGYLSLRFNFPYVEAGRKRPDPGPVLEKAFRHVITALMTDPQNAPARVILGGLGLGARVASSVLAQGFKAEGLVSLSYPLHPSGKPTQLRADPLFRIICPMLFVQGTRDPTCKLDRLQGLLRRIGAPTQLHVVQDADHKLDVIRRSGRTPEEVQAEVLAAVDAFAQRATGSL
jgi:predicted alpha/beta-hydrolase family hydrolase